jgi:hypothetical protein
MEPVDSQKQGNDHDRNDRERGRGFQGSFPALARRTRQGGYVREKHAGKSREARFKSRATAH